MKKYILIIALLIPVVCFSQVQNAGCYLRMIEPANDELSMENDSVKISFTFDSMNYFCKIDIQNKTNEVISVDWDKFAIALEGKSYPIMFDETVMLKKNDPKGTGTVAPGTSLSKNIAAVEYVDLSMPLYNKRWIKKHGNQEIGFVVPVVFGEKLKYYNCKISVSLE